MKMKLGSFGKIKDIDTIADAGFDCIELDYREIVPMSKSEFRSAHKKLADSPLTAECWIGPLPREPKIISPEFSMISCKEFLEIGAERAAEMGARYCCFGNAYTRRLPEDVEQSDFERGRAKILEVIAMCCEVSARYNITVLLEPLAPEVSNFVYTVPEALSIAREIQTSNLKTFIDLRWFAAMQRPYGEIVEYADQIKHVHIDNPESIMPARVVPRITDQFDYKPLFNKLKEIGYKGAISCEANTFNDFRKDLDELMDFFKHFEIFPYRS